MKKMRLGKCPKSDMSESVEVGFNLKSYCKATPLTHLVTLNGWKCQWEWRPHVCRNTPSRGCVTVFDLMKVEGMWGGVMRDMERHVRGGGQGENGIEGRRGGGMWGDGECRGDKAMGVSG